MKKTLLLFLIIFIAFSLYAQKVVLNTDKGGSYNGAASSKDYFPVYEQMDNPVASGYLSQDFETAMDDHDCFLADDFTVPAGETWNIDSLAWIGSWNGSTPLELVHIVFYENNGSIPGSEIISFMNTPCSTDEGSGTSYVLLPSRVSLTEGNYWIGLQARQDNVPDGQWWWTKHIPTSGAEYHWKNPGDAFGTGAIDWTAASEISGSGPNYDLTFGFYTSFMPAPITFIIDNTGHSTTYTGFALLGSWDDNGIFDPGWNGSAEHTSFYDDGTHGDDNAGDDIWTCMYNLVPDAGVNTWEWGVNDQDGHWIDGNWQFTVPDETPQTLTAYFFVYNIFTYYAESINIYPNPSSGVFTISIENKFNLEVLDITGKIIETKVLTENSTVEIKTSGIYFFRFSNEEVLITRRVVVQ